MGQSHGQDVYYDVNKFSVKPINIFIYDARRADVDDDDDAAADFVQSNNFCIDEFI